VKPTRAVPAWGLRDTPAHSLTKERLSQQREVHKAKNALQKTENRSNTLNYLLEATVQ
jgi:hypothetical protein